MDLSMLAFIQARTLNKYIDYSGKSAEECRREWKQSNIDQYIRDNYDFCYWNRNSLVDIVTKVIEAGGYKMKKTGET